MRWPGKIPAGTTCNSIAGNIDLLPTFAKLIGVAPPQDRVLDGRDVTSLMFNPQADPVRDTHLYFTATQSLAAIRQGDWKLFLSAPAPNPFRSRAAIGFDLPAAARVRLGVYDVAGRRVTTLVDGVQSGGSHSVAWDGTGSGGERVTPGVYFCRMETGGRVETRRMALLR